MKRLTALLLCALPALALADELAWSLRTVPEWHELRGDSPFAVAEPFTGIAADRSRQEGELRGGLGPLDLILTARSTAREGQQPDNALVLNQAAISREVGGQHLGLGKRIFSWDVGFGYRPLDLIERENRRQLLPSTLEGVPFVSWERFDEKGSWLLLYANPARGHSSSPFHEESLALKRYARYGDTDVHGVARLSRRFGLELGGAFSGIVGEALEVHGSLLLQARHEMRRLRDVAPGLPLTNGDPLETVSQGGGHAALLGASWSSAGGTTLLAEAWYDGAAWTKGEWRAMAERAHAQAALFDQPGVPAAAVMVNLAGEARAFEAPNLLRGNVLLRLSHHPEGSDLETAADVLFTPADRGQVVTLSLAWQRDRFRIDAGLRAYGGPADAAYRLLPERRVLFAAVKFAF